MSGKDRIIYSSADSNSSPVKLFVTCMSSLLIKEIFKLNRIYKINR